MSFDQDSGSKSALKDRFLSVVSYNILSSTLAATDRKFQGGVFDPDLLDWTARSARLLDELASYDADIVCLQELDQNDYEGAFSTSMLGLGYNGKVFRRRNIDYEHGMAIFFRTSRATLVRDIPIPFPQGIVEGADAPGVMLLLDITVGEGVQRVCMATTHVPCSNGQGGLKKVGQLMALLSAAADLLKKNHDVVFLLTGDFNVTCREVLAKFVMEGSLELVRMCKNKQSPTILKGFKSQTQALRGVLEPSSSVSKADKLKAAKPSEVKVPSEAEKLHALIKSGRDLMDTVVSHPVHTASVYGLNNIVDFIFHGAITGGRHLEVVARLELPERLARLKSGLPAAHLGSDHFALGAKFRIADKVVGLGWSGTFDYIGLPDDGENVVEVDVRDLKRYFP
ncbi:hypothetical protein BGZ72_008995 [Mortierella alpina]|nr:hypothetical protein BGZ72_008995 [Mortierella alpina]